MYDIYSSDDDVDADADDAKHGQGEPDDSHGVTDERCDARFATSQNNTTHSISTRRQISQIIKAEPDRGPL